jgi:hypothetical protein
MTTSTTSSTSTTSEPGAAGGGNDGPQHRVQFRGSRHPTDAFGRNYATMQRRLRMSDVLPQLPDDVSIARADLSSNRVILTPPICTMGEDAHRTQYEVLATLGNGRHLMMGDDPRLPNMPAQPRLADFFRHRFVPMVANHLVQSASLGEKGGARREGRHRMSTARHCHGSAHHQ